MKNKSKDILFYNADEDDVAKCILAGCYKFGAATLLRKKGTTMTSVIEVEPTNVDESDVGIIQVGNIMTEKNFTNPQCGRVYSTLGISPTINTCGGGQREPKIIDDMNDEYPIKLPPDLKGKKFNIRKMTPRECFRVMGVADNDIDKIQNAGISKTSQYKLAGNSIVSGGNYKDSNGNYDGVLFNLFRKMFIETGNENKQHALW